MNLHTERLTLTGYSPEDMNHIFSTLPKAEIMKILGHRSDEEFEKEVYKYKNGYASYNRRFILFLLKHNEADKIIGRCGLHNWNVEHKRAEIGYVMEEEDFKRKGLMTEAVKAILAYGFEELKLNRIEALVGVGNTASTNILQRFNFKKEGVLRQHLFVEGVHKDSEVFSVLKEEYKG